MAPGPRSILPEVGTALYQAAHPPASAAPAQQRPDAAHSAGRSQVRFGLLAGPIEG